MPSRLSDQIPLSNQALELLPLYHTCDALDARAHVERSAIVTTEVCEVFGERITYFFYGRPAFKYLIGDGATTNLALYPVCFVLELDLIGPISRIFPFDSGALFHKKLAPFMHPRQTVLDFEIEPNTNRVNDIVFHFFGSTSNYLNYRVADRDHSPDAFESISYSKMIESFARLESDERRATIEIHGSETVQLSNGAIKAIILPTQLRSSKAFGDFIQSNNIHAQCYDIEAWNPALSFGLVAAAARKLRSHTPRTTL